MRNAQFATITGHVHAFAIRDAAELDDIRDAARAAASNAPAVSADVLAELTTIFTRTMTAGGGGGRDR